MSASIESFNGGNLVRAVLRTARGAVASFRRRLPDAVLDEIVQEAVARWLEASDVRLPCAFVRQVARHLAVDALRRGRTFQDAAEVWVEPWEEVEARMDLRRALDQLAHAPKTHQETLRMLVLEERRIEQVVDDVLRRAGGSRSRAREAIYKRRARATAWMRQRRDRTQGRRVRR